MPVHPVHCDVGVVAAAAVWWTVLPVEILRFDRDPVSGNAGVCRRSDAHRARLRVGSEKARRVARDLAGLSPSNLDDTVELVGRKVGNELGPEFRFVVTFRFFLICLSSLVLSWKVILYVCGIGRELFANVCSRWQTFANVGWLVVLPLVPPCAGLLAPAFKDCFGFSFRLPLRRLFDGGQHPSDTASLVYR
jgi:hypothetical protein